MTALTPELVQMVKGALPGAVVVAVGPEVDGITPDGLPEPWCEHYEERAAIREHHGGMGQLEAEGAALAETVAKMGGGS